LGDGIFLVKMKTLSLISLKRISEALIWSRLNWDALI